MGWYAVAARRWQGESEDLSGMLGGLDEVLGLGVGVEVGVGLELGLELGLGLGLGLAC